MARSQPIEIELTERDAANRMSCDKTVGHLVVMRSLEEHFSFQMNKHEKRRMQLNLHHFTRLIF